MKRSLFISLFLVFLFLGMFIYPVEVKSDNVSVKIYIVDEYKWGQYVNHDKYGRILGDLLVDGKSLSDELVKNGLAVYWED